MFFRRRSKETAVKTQNTSSTTMTNNRVAVVTGANKGIGFFIALELANSGLFSNVVLGCRDKNRGQKAVRDIQKLMTKEKNPSSTEVLYLPLTVGDSDSHVAFHNLIQEKFGKLDVLVNNAAIMFKCESANVLTIYDAKTTLLNFSPIFMFHPSVNDPTPIHEQVKPILDVNYRGTIDLTQTLLPLVRKGDDARMVNVASQLGYLSQISSSLQRKYTSSKLTIPELNNLVNEYEASVTRKSHRKDGYGDNCYGFSKLAVIAATKVLAREEEQNGIKVNCCCPGYCKTDLTSNRGFRDPADGAQNAFMPATISREKCPSGSFFKNYELAEW